MKPASISGSAPSDSDSQQAWRRQIGRLPLTMQPALNQQLSTWDDLFPFEQKRLTTFLGAVSRFQPVELDTLTQPLRALEMKMDVSNWNFSQAADTLSNASQLARSPYYAEWRREVQKIFRAIESAAHDATPRRSVGRVVLLVLPESLPIASIAARKPWDPRGTAFRIDGDAKRVCELALQGGYSLPAQLAAEPGNDDASAAASDCWLIDADATLGTLLPQPRSSSISLLEYGTLRDFRDQFLSQLNTIPKDIEATDQILDRMRRQSWDAWWPKSLAGQDRLRSFMIQLFLTGNGALIFSNAFVQWAASEALRRARPRLIVGRFGLRSKPKPFTSIAIFENQRKINALSDIDDPEGSAVDALILARYVWLSAMRYPEQDETCCVCVGESSCSVYVIAPKTKAPTWAADRAVRPEEICAWMHSRLAD
jgi:hypothetical protein